MYVSNVELTQFRAFESVEVSLLHPGVTTNAPLANVNLLLGDNGAGKSAFLKGVALCSLAPIMMGSGYRPYYLVRRAKDRSPQEAHASVALIHDPRIEHVEAGPGGVWLTVTRREDYETINAAMSGAALGTVERFFEDESPFFFCIGYGATRRTEAPENIDAQVRKRRSLRYQRVAGLFEDFITLTPLGIWLPELRKGTPARFDEIHALLDQVLPETIRFTGHFDDLQAWFKRCAVTLPFDTLSDGYRAYIGLVGDLLYHVNRVCPADWKLTDMSGLVMIDDIDLHLHPAWQREVVPKLAQAFPKLQFILTTHSPIVAGTLHPENILVVEEGDNGSVVRRLTEPIYGHTADQILTSSYFNLDSSRAPEKVKELVRLARNAGETRDPDAAIAFLRSLSGKND